MCCLTVTERKPGVTQSANIKNKEWKLFFKSAYMLFIVTLVQLDCTGRETVPEEDASESTDLIDVDIKAVMFF